MANTITKITYDGNDYEVWTWDVVWPASATDWHLAVFDWATGKLIKDWWVVPTETVVSGDSGVTYTIKVSNSDPSGASNTTITLVP